MRIHQIAYAIVLFNLMLSFKGFSQQSVAGFTEKQISDIHQLVEDLANKDKFSGAVLIATNQKIVYSKVAGLANKAQNSAINLNTKFNIASMSKMFTSIAIAQLVEKKQLKFSDKIVNILPHLSKNIYGKITIHHLLTHTAGTGDIFRNPAFWDIKDTAKCISTYVNIGIDDPIWSKPGSKFSYSNYGYILLGAVIEKISGMNYYDYVKKNIFEVANMINTDNYETDKTNVNLAIGYTVPPRMTGQKSSSDAEKLVKEVNTKMIEVKGTSAGGAYSTANDLLLFSTALLSGKLISNNSVDIVTSGKVVVQPPPNRVDTSTKPLQERKYGYGFGEAFTNNSRSFGHNGGAPGVDAHFYIYPTLGYTIIILANYDRAGEPILHFIQNIINQN